MTWATRPQVQTSPRKPYASAPCQRKSGIRRSWASLSRAGRPGEARERRASGPPSAAAVSQVLTADSEALRAVAMSRCAQPSCFSRRACMRRHSLKSGPGNGSVSMNHCRAAELQTFAQRSVSEAVNTLGDVRPFQGTGAPVANAERYFMEVAIHEARQSVAEGTRANPRVGAVIVRGGLILTTAHRGEMGAGEHAEFTALEKKL